MNAVYENKILPLTYDIGSGLGATVHLHKEIEIIYVLQGESIAYADKQKYHLKNGDTFISFPHQIHYYKTLQPGEYLVIIFSPDIIHTPGIDLYRCTPNSNCVSAEDGVLPRLFEMLLQADGPYKETAVTGYLNIIMSTLLSHFTYQTSVTDRNSTLFSIADYCYRNFRDNITLTSAAETLHLSKYYISHLINRDLNQNFNQYVNDLRIAEACSQLRDTENKISDISEDIGFGTIRSFNRAFKDVMGVTPLEYRLTNKDVRNTSVHIQIKKKQKKSTDC